MKKFSGILKYLKDYKGQIALYSVSSILAVVFSLLALTMLGPVLQVLFNEGQPQTHAASTSILGFVNTHIQSIIAQNGKLTALAYVCVTVVIFIFLKNLFLYIAIYILNPIRNAILRRLRNDLFLKTLSLPISFFTEERKGDLISRMTNDINEVEWSVVSVLEVFIREPVTILFYLISMLIISPQ